MQEPATILYGETQRRILRVTARVWSIDMKKEVELDITGYLANLPTEDIEEMVASDWRRGDIYGSVFWCDRNRDTAAKSLIEYCKAREQSFSVLIDADAADDWYATRA